MPIYEYRCGTCGSRQSVFWRSMSAVKEDTLTCEKCGSKKLSRLVSRVRMVRGGSAGASGGSDELGAGAGMDGMDESLMREMANVDESDPRALGRLMRKMAAASGEDLGPEFGEVVGRLEKGEDPERIEREMGDVFGAGDAGADADGMAGMGGDMAGMDGAADGAAAEPVEKSRPKMSRRKAAAQSAPNKRATPRAAKSTRKTAK